jgi:hypothetical protein
MRIGILTFHAGPNHGAFMQAACLVASLKHLGHQAEVIDYASPSLRRNERFRPWIYRRPLRLLFDIRKRLVFRAERKSLSCSPHFRSYANIATRNYDAIIVGSDVVWNFDLSRLGRDPVYAGVFAEPFHGRRIAYAPSIGRMDPAYVPPDAIISGLRRFDHLSVRDEASRQWLRDVCQLEAELVVDPTWLPPARGLGTTCREIGPSDMLIYAPSVEPSVATFITTYAKARNLRTIAVGYYHPWCDKQRPDIGPLAWPSACRQAACIVSATFHGTLFAIRENTPFVCLATEDMLSKTSHWLRHLGLLDRFWDPSQDLGTKLEQKIVWDSINARIRDDAERSLRWLAAALTE